MQNTTYLLLMFLFTNTAFAASLCKPEETVFFSCQLMNQKIISVCGSKDLSRNQGYMQYRFGKVSKVELQIPKENQGFPNISMSRRVDPYSEYYGMSFNVGAFVYEITSYRQRQLNNKDGYPTSPSSDSLGVRDSRKSMREGDIVFSNECQQIGQAIRLQDISQKTGITINDFKM